MRILFAGTAVVVVVAIAAAVWWGARDPASTTAAIDEVTLGTREACAAYDGVPAGWGEQPQAGMRWIAAGTVAFGSDRGYADERPVRAMEVPGFWIDRTEVTNAQFARFVQATGYVTSAEQGGGAAQFVAPSGERAVKTPGDWWTLAEKTDWRHPDGPGSSLEGRAQEPVVHVSYADAQAYAQWLGHELPSELEWEFAAKAGRDNQTADASVRDAASRPLANFWQGLFPYDNRVEDGFPGRAPVGCFPPNPNGLHDMVGNVWEWTRDAYVDRGAAPVATPTGAVARQVIKGGSYLCSTNYCARARASSRQPQDADLPTSHVGFRTIWRGPAPTPRP